MHRCTKYMHLKQPEKQIKVIELVVTLTQAGWKERVALAHNAINQAFLLYTAIGNTMVHSKIVQDSHSLKGVMINAKMFRDMNRLNYTYWHNICWLLICVHMYVCSCKYASIVETTLVPGHGSWRDHFQTALYETCNLSLLRKIWLRELASYHFRLPGLVNAPTNKWAPCYTYMGMDMVVCVSTCAHIGQREKKNRKILGLESCRPIWLLAL